MSQNQEEEWIEFPCVFPLKVMGLNQNDYPGFVLDVTKKHVPGVDSTCMKTKLSKNHKYVSVTITFTAQNRKQLDDLYMELNASELTKMAI